MPGVLDALVDEVLAFRNKQAGVGGTYYKATGFPSGTGSVAPMMHGPGGLFATSGLERQIISTRIEPRGLASMLPARGSVITNPLYPYITGFTAPTGSNPDGVCDDPKTAGPIKNCYQTADFGRYSFQSREFEVNRAGQRVNRGEYDDFIFVNPPVSGQSTGLTFPATAAADARTMLANEIKMRMLEMGIDFQDVLTKQLYVGNPTNNSSGGGYQEFPGLDILVGTNKVDAKTGTPCNTLHSDIKNFGYQEVSANGGQSILNALTYMMRMLQWNGDRMNMGGVTWAIVMRPQLFNELSAVWPCAYMTYGCQVQTNTQTQLVVGANDQIRMRDDMRNQRYLPIDGINYPVILDDAIDERNQADNGLIPLTGFASDIYVLPLTIRGGSMPALYWEFFDYSAPNGVMDAIRTAGFDNSYWTDGGMYLWARKPIINWCTQVLAKIEPRVILLTPHLAGRLLNVSYNPLQHERDSHFDDMYFINQGVENRPADRLYSDWNPTTPA